MIRFQPSFLTKAKARLDLFPANPAWYVGGVKRFTTPQTMILSFVLIGLTIWLSYTQISGLWVPTIQVPVTQNFIQDSWTLLVDQITLGFNFYSLTSSQINSNLSVNDYFYLGFLNGTQILPSPCAAQFTAINSAIVCFNIPPCVYDQVDSILFYIETAYFGKISYTYYFESLSVGSLLYGAPKVMNSYGSLNYITNQRILQTINKFQIQIYDSINTYSQPASYTSLKITNILGSEEGLSRADTVFVNRAAYQQIVYQRVAATVVLAYFLFVLQTMTTLAAILLITLRDNNVKMKIAKTLFYNDSLIDADGGLWFTFKYLILLYVKKLGFLKLYKDGWLNTEYICFRAFQKVEKRLSVENLLKGIEYLKNRKPKAKPIQNQPFSYKIKEPKEVSDASSFIENSKITDQLIKEKRIYKRRKQTFYRKLIKSFDCNPIPIEIEINDYDKTSYQSIIISAIAISAFFFIIFYLQLFNSDVNINFMSTTVDYQQFSMNRVNGTSIYFYILEMDYLDANFFGQSTRVNFINSSNLAVTIDLVDQNNNIVNPSLPYLQNCTPTDPIFLGNVYTFCYQQPTVLYNSYGVNQTKLRIRLQQLNPYVGIIFVFDNKGFTITNQTEIGAFYHSNGNLIRGTQTTVVFDVKYFLLTSNLYDGVFYDCSFYEQLGFQGANTYPTAYVYLEMSNQFNTQVVSSPSIFDWFNNIFGINLIFFSILAGYLLIPYNQRRTTKIIQQRFLEKQGKAGEASIEILDARKCVAWLQTRVMNHPNSLPFVVKNIDKQKSTTNITK